MSYGADIILALFLLVAFVFYLFFCCMLYKPKPSTVVPLKDFSAEVTDIFVEIN